MKLFGKNLRVVDLSLPIYHQMPIWAGEPVTGVVDFFEIGRSRGDTQVLNMKLYLMCGHVGTHTDAPRHLVNGAMPVDLVPPERYMGPAILLDFSAKAEPPGEDLVVADFLPYESLITPGIRLILRTGWYKHFDDPVTYFDKEAAPKLTPELMTWFNEKQVGLVGVDTPSINPYLDRHVRIFQYDDPPMVLEWMTNLDQVPAEQEFVLIALPLKFTEGDGSPVRAVALIEE